MIDISKYASNMEKLREDAKSFKYDPYPMCIRTYKNRVSSLLGNLKEFSDREIHIFLYDFDYEESGYDKYGWENMKNIHIHKINLEKDFFPKGWTRSTQSKLAYIQDEMTRLGVPKFQMFDDDLKMKVKMCDGKNKFSEKSNAWTQKKIEISLPDALRIEEFLLENTENWGIAGFGGDLTTTWYDEKNIFKRNALPTRIITVNNELLNKNKLHFTPEKKYHEDMDMCIRVIQKGFTCPLINILAIDTAVPSNVPNAAGTNASENNYQMVMYAKWRDYIRLNIAKNGNLNGNVAYKIIEKFPKEFIRPENEELYQACKDMNVDKVYEILENRKKK